MEQEEINRLRELAADADREDDDIRYYSGGSKHNASAEKLTEYIRNALPTLLAQAERVKVLEAALDTAAIRLNVCAGWIEDFPASGTLRAERAMTARHMGDEAAAALEQTRATRD